MKIFFKSLAVLVIALAVFIGYRFILNELDNELDEPYQKGQMAFNFGDYKLALELLEPYAKNGNLNARRTVGEIYAFGMEGKPADNITAQKWFDCAGIDGCTDGLYEYSVALAFEDENMGIKNSEKAKYWMLQSSRKGYKKADDWLASRNPRNEQSGTDHE